MKPYNRKHDASKRGRMNNAEADLPNIMRRVLKNHRERFWVFVLDRLVGECDPQCLVQGDALAGDSLEDTGADLILG